MARARCRVSSTASQRPKLRKAQDAAPVKIARTARTISKRRPMPLTLMLAAPNTKVILLQAMSTT